MGEIVGAALVAHVPTIMLPEETRLEINDGKEITLVPGLERLKTDCLDRVQSAPSRWCPTGYARFCRRRLPPAIECRSETYTRARACRITG